MSFEAWALTPGCPLLREAVRANVSDGGGWPPLTHLKLSPADVVRLMSLLRSNRERGLASIPVSRVVKAVDRVARRFLDPEDRLRAGALEALEAQSGFSKVMAETVMDGMVRDWTRPGLESLLRSEFPDPLVLDEFRTEAHGGRVRAGGYPLTFHLGAGTVPGVGATSIIRGLLVKSAVLLKPGRGDVALPVSLARGLMEVDPVVGESLAVLYWPPDETEKTEGALDCADLVVAYGGDDTVRWIRERTPLHTPLRAYRHRMGVGMVGKAALASGGEGTGSLAMDVARAVSLFDQRGCVSPQVILVEEGGKVPPEAFAEMVGRALEETEAQLPSGLVSPEEGAALQQVRGEGEVAEALGDGFVRHGAEAGPWTLLFQPEGRVEPSCLNRTVRIIPVSTLEAGVALLREWGPQLQTVGLAGLGEGQETLLDVLMELGVSRITTFDQVPWPPPWWHHDGDGPLRTLVRWTDLESSFAGEGE